MALGVVPQIEPVTNLARGHRRIMQLLRNGPVILSQHSKPTAVLVDVETWNALQLRLAALERQPLVERAIASIRAGNYLTADEVDAGFRERGYGE